MATDQPKDSSIAGLVCIECGSPVPELFNNTSSPGNIKLTICDHCNAIADKYVEYDTVLIALDLILHRLSVYRHILFNLRAKESSFGVRYIFEDNTNHVELFISCLFTINLLTPLHTNHGFFQIGYIRLLVSIILVTSYAKLYLLNPVHPMYNASVNAQIFTTTMIEFTAYITVVTLLSMVVKKNWSSQIFKDCLILVTLSAFGHVFALLVVVWEYPRHFISIIHLFCLTSNCVALMAYLKCNPPLALLIVTSASLAGLVVYCGFATLGLESVHLLLSTGILNTVASGFATKVV